MSETSDKDIGILMAMLEKFEQFRLPRLLALKDAVDNGEPLSDEDIEFLEQVIADSTRTMSIAHKNPELNDFCEHVTHLYHAITEKALQNEESS